jgi:hypothetical protein
MQTPLNEPLAMLSAEPGWRSGELREFRPGHWVRES